MSATVRRGGRVGASVAARCGTALSAVLHLVGLRCEAIREGERASESALRPSQIDNSSIFMWSLNWIIQTTAVSPPPVLFVRLSADLQRNNTFGTGLWVDSYTLATTCSPLCMWHVAFLGCRPVLPCTRAVQCCSGSVRQAIGSFQARGKLSDPFSGVTICSLFNDATGQGREGLMAAEATGGDRRAVLILWISL